MVWFESRPSPVRPFCCALTPLHLVLLVIYHASQHAQLDMIFTFEHFHVVVATTSLAYRDVDLAIGHLRDRFVDVAIFRAYCEFYLAMGHLRDRFGDVSLSRAYCEVHIAVGYLRDRAFRPSCPVEDPCSLAVRFVQVLC